MKYSLRVGAGGAIRAFCSNIVRNMAVVALVGAAMAQGTPSKALFSSTSFFATRGNSGSCSFSSFLNYPGYKNTLQIMQGSYWVSTTVSVSDIVGVDMAADGSKVVHVVKDAFLNGQPTMPVRAYFDLKLVNAAQKLGIVRWRVTNRPGVAIQRIWQDTTRTSGSYDGYLGTYFRMDLDVF